ncbi:acetylornithine aminotransferase apoenzyme [Alteribacillus persepolensis]|uniref:Acetylornithine aminotransferase n=1 Tax=Alteribacillus persepolensis TaxID=568899 RepID=A0A1G8H2V0_9BACI|nr:acetylornithine transaminase [Alteribacillus persepolensis]SDI00985.1 acetylornithine aminotransferase apoenzyme [Alteribacillus persepolensis]
MNTTNSIKTDELLFPTYKKWNIAFEQASGSTITDQTGKTYIDMMAGIGVVNLGHGHPAVLEAVEKQLQKGWHASNFFHYEGQEQTAKQLTSHSCADLVFFANSGAEANEAAIKLARKHTGKKKIISFLQSFHGRTFGTMAATGQESIHQGFGPMLEGFEYVPYNDVKALENAIDDETAAVMLEPVQGEGGVIPADDSFLQAAETLAENAGALLICDEIQTGLGRTGAFFAHQLSGIEPDIITTAKALGNGFPTGAVIGKAHLKDAFGPGSHGTTFGGNPLAMAAASATLDTLINENWSQKAKDKGEALLKELQERLASAEVVKEVRGKGMMVGIELNEPAANTIGKLQEKGVLVLAAGPNVLRLLPPLTIDWEMLKEATALIEETLKR